MRFDGRSLEPPLFYGLHGGYFFRRQTSVGVEAQFIHLKVYSNPARRVRTASVLRGASFDAELPLGCIVQCYSISHGVNLLLFNVAARRFITAGDKTGRPRFILTTRAGTGPTIPHTESTIEGARSSTNSGVWLCRRWAARRCVSLAVSARSASTSSHARGREGVWRAARRSRCCARTTESSA